MARQANTHGTTRLPEPFPGTTVAVMALDSPGPHLEKLLSSWRTLAAKADDAFSRTQTKHGALMQCQIGCTGCCQQDLTVLPLEAAIVASLVDQLPSAARQATIRRSRSAGPPCVFLDDDRCAIYEARPLICRTHGLPILQSDTEATSPEASVSVCSLNFVDAVPDDALLDGNRLLEALTLADALFRSGSGDIPATRVALRDIARTGRSALQRDEGLLDDTVDL